MMTTSLLLLLQSSAAAAATVKNGLLIKSNTLFQSPTCVHSRHTLSSIQPVVKHKFDVNFLATHSSPPGMEAFDFQEDEDEDIIVPLSKMRQWTRNKPRGFGEDKVYDTSLEDKLLQELMEQTKLANINNNNKNKKDGNPNNNPKHNKVSSDGDVPNAIRVRLVNLPKKKNIHRDLQAAFKSFPGIISIIPAVSGNHKTREPLCKGFAFVDFTSHNEANRFVDVFSTQPITFGKVQKQIRCEIMKSTSPNPDSVESPLPATMAVNSNPVTETPDAAFDMFKIGDDDLVSATTVDNSFGKLNNALEETHEAEVGSELSIKKQKKVVIEKGKKTVRVKKKVENTPKLSIPGSANRLKIKEKALLSGVFSKYGGKSSD